MSKAFTSEENEDEDWSLPEAPALPAGAKNYITPEGAKRFRQELEQLKAIKNPDTLSGAAKRTKARITYLGERIATFVEQSPSATEIIRFGHQVVLSSNDKFRIVGVDEVDVSAGAISWVSPLAQQLLGKKVGEFITLAGKSLQIQQVLSPPSESI